MQIKKHTEIDARKTARRRFKSERVSIVAYGGIKSKGNGFVPVRDGHHIVYFVETGEHLAGELNPVWESLIYSGVGRDA